MRVDFSLTEEDIEAVFEWTNRRLWGTALTWFFRTGMLTFGVLFLVFAGLSAIGGFLEEWDTSRISTLFACFLSGSVLLGLWWSINRTPGRLFSKLQHDNCTDDLSLEIAPEGLRETSQVSDAFWKWSLVKKSEATGEHFFLLLESNMSIVIPRQAFSSDDAYQAFVDTARAYHAEHLNG